MTPPLNNPRIEFSTKFNAQLEQAPLEIKTAFREALELFSDNPNHPQLRNHPLKEKYSGYNSIDVTGDWRALFQIRESKTKTVVNFQILGTHSQLYGQNISPS